jgi:hypothetical protein
MEGKESRERTETDAAAGRPAQGPECRPGPGWRAWVLSILVAIALSVTATLLLGGSVAFRPERAGVPGAAGSGCGGPCCSSADAGD